MKPIYLLVFTAILFLATACSYFNITEQDQYRSSTGVEETRNYTSIIMGSVADDVPQSLTKMVLAVPCDQNQDDFSNHVFLVKNRDYMLYLPAGRYRVVLLIDDNNDDQFTIEETAGSYQDFKIVKLNEGDVLTYIDLHPVSGQDRVAQFLHPLQIGYDFRSNFYQVENGQVRKLYNAVFSRENAQVGYWSPSMFMRSFGANFYMEDPFDPDKIPVIFVHGSNGSPRDWVYFRLRLDKKRFQPVYFYYPSGLRLTLVARLLHEKLMEFADRNGIQKACLVAHSMGGLITQEILTSYGLDTYPDMISLYVTLATPWSGFESADTAVVTSPKKLPFWIDIASRSMFIKKLMNKALPDPIDHYLFFGKDDHVSRGRALDERAFKNTRGAFAFDVDHTTILSDRRVFRQFEELLEQSFP